MIKNDKSSSKTISAEIKSINPSHEIENINNRKHLFLSDINGKGKIFSDVDFSYSIIQRGYFHKATFENCKFVGTRFIDCIFRTADFTNCDFKYADFTGTIISCDDMFENLPDFPNNRRELLQSLRKNAVTIGDYEAEKKIVIKEIDAKKEHLRLARLQNTPYYKSKYGSTKQQAIVYMKSLGLWLENIVWGHGEKLFRFPLFLVGFSAFISIIHVYISNVMATSTASELLQVFLNIFWQILLSLINISVKDPIEISLIILIPVEISKYLIWGVVAATLYRRLSHR